MGPLALLGMIPLSGAIGAVSGASFGYPYTLSMAYGYQAGQQATNEATLQRTLSNYARTAYFKQKIASELDDVNFRHDLDQYAVSSLFKTYYDMMGWTYQRAFNNYMSGYLSPRSVSYAYY